MNRPPRQPEVLKHSQIEHGVELLSRDRLIARRCEQLAGEEAVLLLSQRADILHPGLGGGAHRVRLSCAPPTGDFCAYATINGTYYGLRLSHIQGVFSLDEAAACGVEA